MKLSHCLLIVLFCVSFTACEKQPALPEVYGIYLRSGEQLVQIDSDKDLLSQYGCQPKSSIIIYDRQLQSAHLPLEQAAMLWRAVPLRFDVTMVQEKRDGPVMGYVIEPLNQISRLGPPVPCVIKPIKNRMDMVEVIPEANLGGDGLTVGQYAFQFMDKQLLFGIGLKLDANMTKSDAATLVQLPEAQPHDQFANVVIRHSSANWGQWATSVRQGWVGSSFKTGKHVMNERLAPVVELDRMENAWKAEFNRLVAENKFTRADNILEWLKPIRPENLRLAEENYGAILAYARTQQKEFPLVAASLAWRVPQGSMYFEEASEVFQSAQAANQEERDQLQSEKQKWEKEIMVEGGLLKKFKYVSQREYPLKYERFGEVVVHENRLKATWDRSFDKDSGWWHMSFIGNVTKFSELDEIGGLDSKKIPYHGISVSFLDRDLEPLRFEFHSEKERDDLAEALVDARTVFFEKHQPETNLTLDFCSTAVSEETGRIVYTIALNSFYWSPHVVVHPMWQNWEFDNNSGWKMVTMEIAGAQYNLPEDNAPQIKPLQSIRFVANGKLYGETKPEIRIFADLK